MKWLHTERSLKDYRGAPAQIQKAFDKQVRLLVQDLRHPSLRVKKYHAPRDIWQARVTLEWRFYFQIQGDSYVIVTIMPHPK